MITRDNTLGKFVILMGNMHLCTEDRRSFFILNPCVLCDDLTVWIETVKPNKQQQSLVTECMVFRVNNELIQRPLKFRKNTK